MGIAIDAGKINRIPYLDIAISISTCNKKSIVLQTISNFSGTEKAISDDIDIVIKEVTRYDFKVAVLLETI